MYFNSSISIGRPNRTSSSLNRWRHYPGGIIVNNNRSILTRGIGTNCNFNS